MTRDGLSYFNPLVADWFRLRYGAPTAIQKRSWHAIAKGDHVLLTAPTGSGKTLAAFLWAIHQLATGQWSTGVTRVLYVSPLKALNNDIQRNLLTPLNELQHSAEEQGLEFPAISAQTRSGDTPQSDRRRMLRYPPEILITTPESVNLLLSSQSGRTLLGHLKTVILDEIHAVLPSRRGTFLMSAIERLVQLSGEFQRIALSATMSPLEKCAEFVGGWLLEGSRLQPTFRARPVEIIDPPLSKTYQLAIRRPRVPSGPRSPDAFWSAYADHIHQHIEANQSTLIFTNSRRLCEKLTYLINAKDSGRTNGLVAYSHHGALAKEIRTEVEKNLKAGRLKAIVATGSLELGIDIGELDEVVIVQSPWSIAEAIQRVGRAGHGVGQVSLGTFLPSHAIDTISTMATVKAIDQGDIESMDFPKAPLDVLTQIIVSMVAFDTWHPDDLFNAVRCAAPYRDLSRRRFDLVVEMLEGRFQEGRIRELRPKIAYDRIDQRLSTRKGAVLALYTSGGVIPDRGYYSLRHDNNSAKIGELDEEFVWEARIGQTFTLGTQIWQIKRITHNDVRVVPAKKGKPAPPFWKAEESNRSFHLSHRIGVFLEQADTHLNDKTWVKSLPKDYHIDAAGTDLLIRSLKEQQRHTGCSLPHRHHLVVEDTPLGSGKSAGRQIILHTLWGGAVNRPFAIALEAAWQEKIGNAPQFFAGNETVSCLLADDIPASDIMGLVKENTVESLLVGRLAQTGFFGARFRECAARALLLPKGRFNQRTPLWVTRLNAQKLLKAIAPLSEFPIILETWRTCLQDEFDLPQLKQLLWELENGKISYTCVQTPTPSPFARDNNWRQVNHYLYLGDGPAPVNGGRPSPDLLYEVSLNPALRPAIPLAVVTQFEQKRQRLLAGYAPDSAGELLEWVKERVLLPLCEWHDLLTAVDGVHQIDRTQLVDALGDKIVLVDLHFLNHNTTLVLAREDLSRVLQAFYPEETHHPSMRLFNGQISLSEDELHPKSGSGDKADSAEDMENLFSQWLSYYGPIALPEIADRLGLAMGDVSSLVAALVDVDNLVSGTLIEGGSADMVCDRENFEILLRMSRKAAAPSFSPLSIDKLPLFLAAYQGVALKGPDTDMARRLDQLLGWHAPAAAWESDFLPARFSAYRRLLLDAHLQTGDMIWCGAPGKKTTFCYEDELDLIRSADSDGDKSETTEKIDTNDDQWHSLFPHPHGRYPFSVLQQFSGVSANSLAQRLWLGVWQGRLSNDGYAALRMGIEMGFDVPVPALNAVPFHSRRPGGRRIRRSGSHRLPAQPVNSGNWFLLPEPDDLDDVLEKEEIVKERVRLLFERYGILFRELLSRELPIFRWGSIFRALRLMELSGEILGGYFFEDLPGLQFVRPPTLSSLGKPLPEDAVYWLNATDPASLCGSGLTAFKGKFPNRLAGSHMVFHGSDLVIVSKQNAKRLDIHAAADHPRLSDYFSFIHHLLTRDVMPLRSIGIESINDRPAGEQIDYFATLEQLFDASIDFKSIVLFRKH